jgi:hypothetical protein
MPQVAQRTVGDSNAKTAGFYDQRNADISGGSRADGRELPSLMLVDFVDELQVLQAVEYYPVSILASASNDAILPDAKSVVPKLLLGGLLALFLFIRWRRDQKAKAVNETGKGTAAK